MYVLCIHTIHDYLVHTIYEVKRTSCCAEMIIRPEMVGEGDGIGMLS